MAYDKVVDSTVLNEALGEICGALRNKEIATPGVNLELNTTTGKNEIYDAINKITKRSSSDLTASGATVTAPAGYYP